MAAAARRWFMGAVTAVSESFPADPRRLTAHVQTCDLRRRQVMTELILGGLSKGSSRETVK